MRRRLLIRLIVLLCVLSSNCSDIRVASGQTVGDAPLIRAAGRAAAELKAARTLIASLEKQRILLEGRLNANEATIAALNSSLASSRANAAELTRKLAAAEDRLKAQQAELLKVRADLTTAQARIAELESELAQMRTQAQAAQQAQQQTRTPPPARKPSRTWVRYVIVAGLVAIIVTTIAAN